MKRIRKVAAALFTLCLLCPCISTVVNAASAQLRFTDPSTTVGAEVEIKAKVTSAASIQSVEAALSFDASMLKFRSGDSATGGDGTVTISGSGNGTEVTYILKFQALQEGTTKIEVASSSGTTSSGEALEITNGSSSVTIGPGDPSLITEDEPAGGAAPAEGGGQITIGEAAYSISNDFSDALIPTGFVRSEMTYEGANCQVIKQEAGEGTAMYLQPSAGGEADFFLYDGDKGKFTPFQQIDISQDRYILLLDDDKEVKLPKAYQKTTLTIDGKDFPVWQDTDHPDYYIVYAMNNEGQKGMYQYDSADKTYQRYIKAKAASDDSSTASPKGLWGKVLNFIQDALDLFVIAGCALFLVFIILLIVVGVKLHHRNVELDDLYDEYGIDLDEEEEPKKKAVPLKSGAQASKSPKKEMKPAVRKPLEEDEDFEDFEDFEDDEFDDAEFDEAFDNEFGDYVDDEEYTDGYGTEDERDFETEEIEDLDDLLGENSKKKRGHMEEDDTFKVDFIDLD